MKRKVDLCLKIRYPKNSFVHQFTVPMTNINMLGYPNRFRTHAQSFFQLGIHPTEHPTKSQMMLKSRWFFMVFFLLPCVGVVRRSIGVNGGVVVANEVDNMPFCSSLSSSAS